MDSKKDYYYEIDRKLQSQLKKYPLWFRNYFVRVGAMTGKNQFCCLKKAFHWLINEGILLTNEIENIKIKDLQNLKPSNITSYLKYEYTVNGLKYSTVSVKKGILSSFWDYLVKEGYVKHNIVAKKDRGDNMFSQISNNVPKEYKYPEEKYLIDILNEIDKVNPVQRSRDMAILHLFVGSSIRIQELVFLNVEDVDFENLKIVVTTKGRAYDYTPVEKFISLEAAEYLKDWINIRTAADGEQALFVKLTDGRRLSEHGVRYLIKRYSREKITPHMLRHYSATHIAEMEMEHVTKITQQHLGHSNSITSKKHYIHKDKVSSYRNTIRDFRIDRLRCK